MESVVWGVEIAVVCKLWGMGKAVAGHSRAPTYHQAVCACGGCEEATEAPNEMVHEAGARSWEMGGGGRGKWFRGSYRSPQDIQRNFRLV